MSKNMVKESSKKINQKGNPSPMEFNEPFVPVVRRELNRFGILLMIGVWGLVAFVVGIKMTQNNHIDNEKLALLEKKIEQLEMKERQSVVQANAEIDGRVNFVKTSLEKKYDERLYQLTSEQRKVLEGKQQIIENLKDEVFYKKLKTVRGIASVPEKVVPYSRQNADILRYEHEQQVSRLKNLQKKRENTFLSGANLTDPENREVYVSMQEKHKLELYSLRRNFQAERKKFKTEKFYVRN